MRIQYLEIVTPDADALCETWQAVHGIEFGPPVEVLGNARTGALPDGGRVAVRGPLRDDEEPVVRPYVLVDDIDVAVAAAAESGAEIAHPPLELPGEGTFAIVVQGGIQHGFWQD